MAPPRRTPLRHDSPIDRPSSTTRQSPSDSARITSFGIRAQSLSPISPRVSTTPLSVTPTNAAVTTAATAVNTSTQEISMIQSGGGGGGGGNMSNIFLASPDPFSSSRSLIQQQQQQQPSFLRTHRSGFLDSFGSPYHDNSSFFGSLRNDDLLQSRNYARRHAFQDPSLASTNHSIPHTNTLKHRLRVLRNDAAQHHLNGTAIFFAEKVVAITSKTQERTLLFLYESNLFHFVSGRR